MRRSLPRRDLDLVAVGLRSARALPDAVPVLAEVEPDVGEQAPRRAARVDAEELAARAVEERHALLRVGRHEAGRHRRDDVAVEMLEPLEGLLPEVELIARRAQLLREVRDHERDAVEAGDRDRQVVANARAAPVGTGASGGGGRMP